MTASPLVYRRIRRLLLRTSDVRRLFDFYMALGLEAFDSENGSVLGFRIGPSELHIVEGAPGAASSFELEVDELSDLRCCTDRIRGAGGQIIDEPWLDSYTHCWNLSAIDPDGNKFHVSTFVEALREQLLDELKRRNDLSEGSAIEEALRALPRHHFLPNHPLQDAYANRAMMTKSEGEATSSCSQPTVVARMLRQASLKPGDNVLEIGAGTGWNSALISQLVGAGGFVTTIDIDEDTAEFARSNLARAGVSNVEVICGDGGQGFESEAPYDAVMVTAQMPDVSPVLASQLRMGGRLVVPQWFNTVEFAVAFEKVDSDKDVLVSRSVSRCGFMPLRGEFSGPIARSHVNGLAIDASSDLVIDPEALYATLSTPYRQVTVAALTGEWDNKFLEYAALTGEPLVRFHMGSGAAHPYCFFVSNSHFALIYTSWDSGKEVLNPSLYVYGDDFVLARIEEVAARWVEEGRPGLDDAQITMAPVGTLQATPGSYLVRKQWMDYQVTFGK